MFVCLLLFVPETNTLCRYGCSADTDRSGTLTQPEHATLVKNLLEKCFQLKRVRRQQQQQQQQQQMLLQQQRELRVQEREQEDGGGGRQKEGVGGARSVSIGAVSADSDFHLLDLAFGKNLDLLQGDAFRTKVVSGTNNCCCYRCCCTTVF